MTELPETRSTGRELCTLQLQLSAEPSWLPGRCASGRGAKVSRVRAPAGGTVAGHADLRKGGRKLSTYGWCLPRSWRPPVSCT